MKLLYKIIRSLILTVILLALVAPVVLYLALELKCIQNPVKHVAETELSKLIGAGVEIGSVSIAPFNRFTLRDVKVIVAENDTTAKIKQLGAGIDLYTLFLKKRFVVGYVELIGLDAKIHRATIDSPLNIEPIIKTLSPKPGNPPSTYDLAINTIVVRKSSVSYDVIEKPTENGDLFDPNHIHIYGLRSDIKIPKLSNSKISLTLNRLAFAEKSGFTVDKICMRVEVGESNVQIIDPSIELPNTSLNFSSILLPKNGDFKQQLPNQYFNFALLQGSYISLSDFAAFLPQLSSINSRIDSDFDIDGTLDDLKLNRLSLKLAKENIALYASKTCVRNTMSHPDNLDIELGMLEVNGECIALANLITLSPNVTLNDKIRTLLANINDFNLLAIGSYRRNSATLEAAFTSSKAGSIDIAATLENKDGKPATANIQIKTDDTNLGALLTEISPYASSLGQISLEASASLTSLTKPVGNLTVALNHIDFKSEQLGPLNFMADFEGVDDLNWNLDSNDEMLRIMSKGHATKSASGISTQFEASLDRADFSLLDDKLSGYEFSLNAIGDIENLSWTDTKGDLAITEVEVSRSSDRAKMRLDSITAAIDTHTTPQTIAVSSEIADFDASGNFDFREIIPTITNDFANIFPALGLSTATKRIKAQNDFHFNLTLKSSSPIEEIVKLPISVIYPISVRGRHSDSTTSTSLEVDAPYILQGKKLIEFTHLIANMEGADSLRQAQIDVDLSTRFPVKSGKVDLSTRLHGLNDHIDTRLAWRMDREQEFSGDISLSTKFSRTDDRKTAIGLHFNPGKAVFNDTVWTIEPSDISIAGKEISVDNFYAGREGQSISINGRPSETSDDSLRVTLADINLDYVFETLGISNAMFGGRASGNLYAASVFSKTPHLYTNDLHVSGIKYNHCLMGDAEIKSRWNMEDRAVEIHADITGDHENVSIIDGFIKPLTEELDFKFHADDVPVGFLLPFMEAFTSAVDGHASGDAHLYGTFKLLDMTGDLFANDFKLKLDFTNCWYSTTDSIKLRPGRIDIPSVTLCDPQGNKAKLSGWVTHKCFKQPEFEFHVSDAQHLLVYNQGATPESIWYGKIYGDGRADIKGVPGRIDIKVNMSTAENSNFTFVLSDNEQAAEYSFLTFNDITPRLDTESSTDPRMEMVQQIIEQSQNRGNNNDIPSIYAMEIAIAVKPNTLVTLVMDPIGGDCIKARGAGDLRLAYNSADENLELYGAYTLNEGNYNFTLQDIIIKDFVIEQGSEISFTGDPYAAKLNVNAIYSLNANLSDLDESFLQDNKELNRTNVPLQALMKVTGDIRQPAIAFDLRFPTLSDDTYRKVKSIISTEEMMNRQIIYLLALNRFYTPDYMATTKGNELVSVASSTISSQLANMLGQLSDNWSIAPNIRSDRGDFSDVEFDVALSSRLLNNRLLFNGNLGYRDKSMNNNSFIGDFDIEYLLNRSGSLRFKAYNRYNDRNFYVKTALTTQGIGLMYRRDFDRMFQFLRPKRKKSEATDTMSATPDSISR